MSAECLFNTVVPLTVRPAASFSGNFNFNSNPTTATQFTSTYNSPFFTTNATQVQFQDDTGGKRVNTVVFEIYLHTIVANKKNLQLRISDVNDPFFMWQLDLTEEEFFGLRNEQNLLVDFQHFPYKLIELLQKCLTSNASEPQASFFAQLTVNSDNNTANLSFVERTSFRQVNQLTLKLRVVESEVLKKKLAELLKNYREQISSLQSQLSTTNTTTSTNILYSTPPQSIYTGYVGPQSQAQKENLQTTSTQTTRHVHTATGALVREKDEACAHLNQLYEVTKEAKSRIEQENSDLKREIEVLHNQFEESQREVLKANEIINKLQEEVRNFKNKLKSTSAIADDQMNAAEQLRSSNKRLQAEYSEAAEKAHNAKIQAEVLERDNKTLKGTVEQLEKAIQQRDSIIAHHQRQSNVKDLDRAIRNLDENILEQSSNITNNNNNNNNNNNSELNLNAADFTFESSGYVGSRIFDQTF